MRGFLGLTDCHIVYYVMGGPMDSCTHDLLGYLFFGFLGISIVTVLAVAAVAVSRNL